MPDKIWLSKPHISSFELNFVEEAFKSNWLTTHGENIDNFEKDLENYLENEKFVLALNSGTSALHIALILLNVKSNDEVICPSFTFCASANPILYQNATPIFVDSELETWNISPYYLEEAIKDRILKGKNIKAIIVVNIYGMPAKWDEIILISQKYNIPIIEDSAESLGSIYKGKKCGVFGDFSFFSFNGNKIITTTSGGALICRNYIEKERALHISSQANSGKVSYVHNEIGFNYRISNVLAGIGRGQMKVLNKRLYQKRKIHFFYKKIFKNIDEIILHDEREKNISSNFWLNCIYLKTTSKSFNIENLIKAFDKENIEVRKLWKPLHTQNLYKKSVFYGENNCLDLYKRGLCLPSGSNLSKKELIRIKKVLIKFNDLLHSFK